MDLKENFSKNVRELRRLKHKTMDEFAVELGIGKSTLQGIEQKKSNSTLETVQTVAGRLGVSPLALLSDEMEPQKQMASANLMGTLELFRHLGKGEKERGLDLFAKLVDLLSGPQLQEEFHESN